MYTPKTIQNQLIRIIGKLDLLGKIKQAAFYLVIADEVCDVSNTEQLSLCVRYIHQSAVKEVLSLSGKDHWKDISRHHSS